MLIKTVVDGPTPPRGESKFTQTRLLGLVSRRVRWGLSASGWLLVVIFGFSGCAVVFLGAYPFLAVTDRTDAKLLVVEGWVRDYAIQAGIDEFRRGSYEQIFTTGGPTSGSGGYTADWDTSASVGAGRLKALGVPAKYVQMVPARMTDVDRTYTSAVALRDWFRENHVTVESINIVTENVHARRTRLLFTKAFDGKVRVGIIAVRCPDYDPARWWANSQGVKDIVGEGVGYVYAILFCLFRS